MRAGFFIVKYTIFAYFVELLVQRPLNLTYYNIFLIIIVKIDAVLNLSSVKKMLFIAHIAYFLVFSVLLIFVC